MKDEPWLGFREDVLAEAVEHMFKNAICDLEQSILDGDRRTALYHLNRLKGKNIRPSINQELRIMREDDWDY